MGGVVLLEREQAQQMNCILGSMWIDRGWGGGWRMESAEMSIQGRRIRGEMVFEGCCNSAPMPEEQNGRCRR